MSSSDDSKPSDLIAGKDPRYALQRAEIGMAERLEPIKVSQISSLLDWRQRFPDVHRAAQIEGLRSSERLRVHLKKIQQGEPKRRWLESILKNPKFGRTENHRSAKDWYLFDPQGKIWKLRNLRNFIREHEELFETVDIQWRHGATTWCPAYQALAKLRPGVRRPLTEWKGWRWAGYLTDTSTTKA